MLLHFHLFKKGLAHTRAFFWGAHTDQSITIINGGAYEVTVTDFNNCTGVSSVFVTENPLPIPNITGVLAFCAGQSTTLDAGPGYQSYQWSTGEFPQNITLFGHKNTCSLLFFCS